MTTKKPSAKKKANVPPAYDADFRSRFGINVAPVLADVFRCKICRGYIYPLRRLIWCCEVPLCGPLFNEAEIYHRLSCHIFVTGKIEPMDLIRIVRSCKPE